MVEIERTDPMSGEDRDTKIEEPVAVATLSRRGAFALRLAAVFTLVGLALMVWSMVQPTPLPVMLAMTAGQTIGTAAFGLYIYVVVRVLRKEYRRR